MFKKLIESIQKLGNVDRPDPQQLAERFGDPLVMKTDWTPAAHGGSNFRTQKLVEVSSMRMEFRATVGMLLFCGLFAVAGLGMIVGFFVALAGGSGGSLWVLLLVGVVFAGVGAALYYAMSRPRVFDLDALWYWKGKKPFDAREVEQRTDTATLDTVHAIQLIREYCHSSGKNSSSYYSFEINLVMHDGSRVNVIDHGHLATIRADADKLGRFIGVPVWDAT